MRGLEIYGISVEDMVLVYGLGGQKRAKDVLSCVDKSTRIDCHSWKKVVHRFPPPRKLAACGSGGYDATVRLWCVCPGPEQNQVGGTGSLVCA